jgi:hypothetical protein
MMMIDDLSLSRHDSAIADPNCRRISDSPLPFHGYSPARICLEQGRAYGIRGDRRVSNRLPEQCLVQATICCSGPISKMW